MPAPADPRVNDFTIKIATVNGTGSASANTLLMKSIFRSGIPVMGKNYFPSNIQGLPTWYEIRVTRDGYVACSGRIDIMVAMNAETYARDAKEVAPGGYLVYDSTWPRPALLKREDITVLGVPLARLCNENFNGVRTRILMKNICYAGVLAALLDLDLQHIRTLLLTLLFRFMKPLVEAGHIYLAQPPLYKIKWEGRGVKPGYAFSDPERDRLIEAGIAEGRKDPRPRDGVQRFKGLGEMNATELWETTMDPASRVLLQVTLDDAAQADELFSVLMGEDVEARRSFITRNARDVRFLDI